MKLSEQDAELFFHLIWSLQFYVNQKLGIFPKVDTLAKYHHLPSSEKITVRNALYDNIKLIDAYLDENPQNFSEEELEIVKGWKKFKDGNFFIERLLKKHAIFIGDDKVYAVIGLLVSFDDLLSHIPLPYYTKAVLLPFKGQIVYDGLLEGYSIFFGSGVKFDLKETYLAAKQNGEIILSFDPKMQAAKTKAVKKPTKDWGPAIEEISQQAKKLRSSSGAPAIHSPAFSLAKASIEFAKLAVDKPEDIDDLWKALEKVERAIRKAETVLMRTH